MVMIIVSEGARYDGYKEKWTFTEAGARVVHVQSSFIGIDINLLKTWLLAICNELNYRN